MVSFVRTTAGEVDGEVKLVVPIVSEPGDVPVAAASSTEGPDVADMVEP